MQNKTHQGLIEIVEEAIEISFDEDEARLLAEEME